MLSALQGGFADVQGCALSLQKQLLLGIASVSPRKRLMGMKGFDTCILHGREVALGELLDSIVEDACSSCLLGIHSEFVCMHKTQSWFQALRRACHCFGKACLPSAA